MIDQIIKYIFLFTMCNMAFAVNQKDLQNWYTKIADQSFNCPAPKETDLKLLDSSQLLNIVDCEDSKAVYRYEFKVLCYSIHLLNYLCAYY